jgi:hypothetical protein
MKYFLILLIFSLSIVPGFTISDAYGYIDPGSGSIVIQALVGALVGVGITLRIYWYKIKEKFLRSSKNDG